MIVKWDWKLMYIILQTLFVGGYTRYATGAYHNTLASIGKWINLLIYLGNF